MKQYKRFMVFTWLWYDNVPPFECIDGDFDSLEEAKSLLCEMLRINHYLKGCIFDRVEGCIVKE